MKFKDFASDEAPAAEIFNSCIDLAFDEGDENTEHLDRISPEARLVYLLWHFDGEIHNGGFHQFFSNSLGDHCTEILEGLRKIGAVKSAELLEAANKWFPNSKPPQNREERCAQLDQVDSNQEYEKDIEKLNEEFWQYEDNLAELLHSFVRQNPDATVCA